MKLLRSKKIAISLVGIIFAIVVAIVVHALLPASVDVNDFDSLLEVIPVLKLLSDLLSFLH